MFDPNVEDVSPGSLTRIKQPFMGKKCILRLWQNIWKSKTFHFFISWISFLGCCLILQTSVLYTTLKITNKNMIKCQFVCLNVSGRPLLIFHTDSFLLFRSGIHWFSNSSFWFICIRYNFQSSPSVFTSCYQIPAFSCGNILQQQQHSR